MFKCFFLILLIRCSTLNGSPTKRQINVHWNSLLCDACHIVLDYTEHLELKNKTSQAERFATHLCRSFHLEDQKVCDGLISSYKLPIEYAFNVTEYNPIWFCDFIFNCETGTAEHVSWNVTLPTIPKPPVIPPQLPKVIPDTLRILHLSDIHLDLDYVANGVTDCGEPLCCRNGTYDKGQSDAWKWGDYRNCDTPMAVLTSLMVQLKTEEKFDFIYFTGDLPPHTVWGTSKNDSLKYLSITTNIMKIYLNDFQIYPAVGNHESSPMNLFPSERVNITDDKWLYKALADSWINTLKLPSEIRKTVENGGYYELMIKERLRIISLNTIFCYRLNFWLLVDNKDPYGQLQWLVDILQHSENRNIRVHIIGHIPPGNNDCIKTWSWNYNKIVQRYESTIVAQFFGHTHRDHFEIFYDNDYHQRPTPHHLVRPINIAYITPSVTPYAKLNSGYRIYEVEGDYDKSNYFVLNHRTVIMNINEAEKTNKPEWKLEYDAKNAYQLKSLFPIDWHNLTIKLENDEKLFDQFYGNFMKNSTVRKKCDKKCKANLICSLRTSRSFDFTFC
ncbi:hypothetical protein SNEBB_005773 [Seison nebaliae]|nr:hypothetical protein SNEBB_005773 [Seison nebaliae]